MKNSIKLIALCCILLATLCACGNKSYLDSAKVDLVESESLATTEEVNKIGFVQIIGAVKNPGVYEINENERLFTIIEMAGGLTEDAAIDSVNQVQVVSDEDIIKIPTVAEVIEAENKDNSDQSGKININTADASMLMTLSGIGESKAKLIVDFRDENGPFKSIEDIMTIPGIKEGVYNKIKDDITVG